MQQLSNYKCIDTSSHVSLNQRPANRQYLPRLSTIVFEVRVQMAPPMDIPTKQQRGVCLGFKSKMPTHRGIVLINSSCANLPLRPAALHDSTLSTPLKDSSKPPHPPSTTCPSLPLHPTTSTTKQTTSPFQTESQTCLNCRPSNPPPKPKSLLLQVPTT